ncbi:hypothetical protein GBAR_LOCUS11280 [Geodia barretti]|uniref:Uncharacterized protein n=1 Tax=Geodia barretti TaxID=519541 RepID=A0AA35WIQ6_GEOBA|nr:hypothetical protein GBAR_LOCUS11280 [Geodia barretti]
MSSFEQFLTKTSSAVIYAHVLHDLGKFKSKFSDAFVEREYLSTADELVTIGNGGFQTILVEQFLQHSIKNKEHLHSMCFK